MAGMETFGKFESRGRHEAPKNMRGSLIRLFRMTKGHRQGFGWLLVLSALSAVSSFLTPLLIGYAMQAIYSKSPVTALIVLLLAVYLLDWFVNFLQQFLMAHIGQRVVHFIRISLFDAMKSLPLAFFDRHRHGELMSRLTNDVDNISTTISTSLTSLLTYGFTILGILVVMLTLSLPLTLTALAGVAVILLWTRFITRHTRKMYTQQQRDLGVLNAQIEEGISGAAVVKAFGREKQLLADFQEANRALRKTATAAMIWSGYLMPITSVINNLDYIAVAIIGGLIAVQGQVTIGVLSSFLLYARQFLRPFVEVSNIFNEFQTAVAGVERIFEIMDETPEPPDMPDALPLVNPRGEIVFSHVSFSYVPGVPVLTDFSVRIPAGAQAAIVGPTGAGKTTIINLLTRFYDVDSGQILLDGHDLREYRIADLRRAFGVVLQDTALFAETVRYNLSYGKKDASDREIRHAAEVVDALPFIERLPQGFQTYLAQSGMELSQGERQLLTIARALLADAPILILDEATSSVDTLTEQKIRRAMLTITKGRTSILIAHRLSTIRDSDMILMIEDGKLTEKGTHEELLARNGHYAKMYRQQTGNL